jgi:hypothetical protein
MLLAVAGTTPPPPPPPGAGYQRVAQELSNALSNLTLGKAGVLAETVVRTGRTASDAIAAWNAAYTINSVDKDEATVLSMVTLLAGAKPTAIRDAYDAAYSINSIDDKESLDLATRMVLRRFDVPTLRPTYDRLYAISDVTGESAEKMVKAAVSANATPDQVLDSYAWYRSQPGGTPTQATTWTVDHLKELSGGFDATHDQMLADLTSRVAAVR